MKSLYVVAWENVRESTYVLLPWKKRSQAVAAAKAGASVRMVGTIGIDPFGNRLLQSLQDKGVHTKHVRQKEGGSGLAFITVNETGEIG